MHVGICHVKDSRIKITIKDNLELAALPDSTYKYCWNDASKEWDKEIQYSYVYDSKGNTIKKIISKWIDNRWLPNERIEFFYEDNCLTKEVRCNWDDYNLYWTQYKKKEIKYNNLKKAFIIQSFLWSELNSKWLNDSLYSNEFNELNLRSYQIKNKWSNQIGDWESSFKTGYLYDSIQNNTLQAFYKWEFDLLIWQVYQKKMNKYNDLNKIIEQEQQVMNSFYTTWVKDWKINYVYIDSQVLHEEIYYDWIETDQRWLEYYKFVYNYDAKNIIIRKTGYNYDWDHLTWENHFLQENSFNDDNALMVSTYYKWQHGVWEEYEKFRHFYNAYISIESSIDEQTISVYPNPANEKLSIVFLKEKKGLVIYEMYDIKGIKINIQNNFNPETGELLLLNVNAGIYLLKLLIGDSVLIKKIIVRH